MSWYRYPISYISGIGDSGAEPMDDAAPLKAYPPEIPGCPGSCLPDHIACTDIFTLLTTFALDNPFQQK